MEKHDVKEREQELQEMVDNFIEAAKAKQLTVAELDILIHRDLEQKARQLKIAE